MNEWQLLGMLVCLKIVIVQHLEGHHANYSLS